MNDIVWFPDLLDAIEAEHDAAIAADARRAKAEWLPAPALDLCGLDFNELYVMLLAAEARKLAAEEVMRTAGDDGDARDRAGLAWDAASDEAGLLAQALFELEQAAGHQEWRAEMRNRPIW